MTQVTTPFKDRRLRMARQLPDTQYGRPLKELTTEQKRLARHLANNREVHYTGEEIMKLVGFAGRINTFRRLLRECNIKTYNGWLQRKNQKDC